MKDIFTDLYNKVLGFFRQTEKKEEESAKAVACNRLKFVLMQDRTNLTPELMDRMRKELIELLSRYVEMDKEALELNLEQDGDQVALMLSIPVIRAKDEDEIKAALEAEDKEKEDSKEISQETDNDDELSQKNDENLDEGKASDEISKNDANNENEDENSDDKIEITTKEEDEEKKEK